MKAGSTQGIMVDLHIDLSTVQEAIFTFADESKKMLLQKRYPGEVQEVEGKLYIPLDQDDTLLLCGYFLMEGQVNFVDKSVSKTKTFKRHMHDTLATEIVDGNAPNTSGIRMIDADISEGIIFVNTGGPSYEIGDGLKLEGNVLSVDTATEVEEDNTKPVTSGAVYTTVVNINALLETI